MKKHSAIISIMLALAASATASEVPDRLHLVVGGFLGPSYDVVMTNGVLQYKAADSSSHLQNAKPETIAPTDDQWKSFNAALETIGVWNWKTNYINANVVDGTHWLVVIEWGKKAVETRGVNAYPNGKGHEQSPTFRRFTEAVRKLLAGKKFQ